MREVGSNTGCVDHIVERELTDEGGGLEEEGQRLSHCQLLFLFRNSSMWAVPGQCLRKRLQQLP
jgi:hypothetical protein